MDHSTCHGDNAVALQVGFSCPRANGRLGINRPTLNRMIDQNKSQWRKQKWTRSCTEMMLRHIQPFVSLKRRVSPSLFCTFSHIDEFNQPYKRRCLWRNLSRLSTNKRLVVIVPIDAFCSSRPRIFIQIAAKMKSRTLLKVSQTVTYSREGWYDFYGDLRARIGRLSSNQSNITDGFDFDSCWSRTPNAPVCWL